MFAIKSEGHWTVVPPLTVDGGAGGELRVGVGPGEVQPRAGGAGQAQRGPRRRRQRAHGPRGALLAPRVAHRARVVVRQVAVQACNHARLATDCLWRLLQLPLTRSTLTYSV